MSIISTLRTWVATALPTLTEVINLDPLAADAPRPDLPYATVQLRTDQAMLATPIVITTETPGADPAQVVEEHRMLREVTVQVDAYGSGATDLLRDLAQSMARQDVRDVLRAGSVSVTPLGPVIDERILRGDVLREEHGTMDFRALYYHTTTVDVDWIASATPTLEQPS